MGLSSFYWSNLTFKYHWKFVASFTFLIFVFFWKILFMHSAFLGGDFVTQHYPWSWIYAESIKAFQFPFWTKYFHSGFPLMAEGQIGGFYPLNMIFFFFLPFSIAYNYTVVFHFVLAGIFTYVYARRIGACQWGGLLATLLFCFGSAYAGCMVNIATVKTFAWFPLVLWMFEGYFDRKNTVIIFGAGIVVGMQLLAGSTQFAIYSVLFYLIYFIYGLITQGNLKFRDIGVISGGLTVAGIIFLPQFLLSWPLTSLSGRSGASLGFALWGSFSPLNFMSIVFPYWVFQGNRFYIGIFSLLFLIAAFLSVRSNPRIRPLVLLLLISVFFAMGKYNPLYILFLKISQLYSLRNPSKFLLFGVFMASVLSGWGFTRFFETGWNKTNLQVLRIFSIFITAMMCLFFLAKLILKIFGEKILNLGEWYAANYIHGKYYHRHDLSTYMSKVRSFYTNLVENAAILNPFILTSIFLCIASLVICRYLSKKKQLKSYYKGVFITAIFLDLFVFGIYGTGFRGNIISFNILEPEQKTLYNIVNNEKGIFRILPYNIRSRKLPDWAIPNANITYGIDSVGAYSPLAVDSYFKKMKGLEVVDNSLGFLKPSNDSLKKNKKLLQFLNVRYVVSSERKDLDFMNKLAEEEGVYLYEVKDSMPRGYVVRNLTEPVRILEKDPEIDKYESGSAIFLSNTKEDGFFVFSEFGYPGWQATVDGDKVQIRKFQDILMAVHLPKGRHEIKFRYSPF